MKFVKRPVIVEAVRWFKDGDHPAVVPHIDPAHDPDDPILGVLKTADGDMFVCPGDYVVTRHDGALNTFPASEFEAFFEPVDEAPFREGPDENAKPGDLVTARPIVIAAGAKIGPAPLRAAYGTPHGSVLIGFGADAVGDMRFDIEEALKAGAIKRVQPRRNKTMNEFYGTKLVKAKPMTRLDYNKYRGWTLPEDEDGGDEGYLVEYCDGGKTNHPDHEGYISWSPKEQFDNAYQRTDMMSFGHALVAMKAGKRVARAGWNGKGMFVFLVGGSRFLVNREPLESILGYGTEVVYRPHMDLKTADGSIATWSPSGSDALAEDWQIVA